MLRICMYIELNTTHNRSLSQARLVFLSLALA